jgi:hypothetical protein
MNIVIEGIKYFILKYIEYFVVSEISENAIVLVYSNFFERSVLCRLAAGRVGVELVSVCVEVGIYQLLYIQCLLMMSK